METTDKEPSTSASLDSYLRELHLPTVRQCYADVACQARQESLSYVAFCWSYWSRNAGCAKGIASNGVCANRICR